MRTNGFTLLELLVVLALLGLMTGLALPRLDRMFDSFRFSFEQEEALNAIGDLVFQAREQGRGFELLVYPDEGNGAMPLRLPAGWQLQAEAPIRYSAAGLCHGGTVRLSYAGRTVTVELAPPFCQPQSS